MAQSQAALWFMNLTQNVFRFHCEFGSVLRCHHYLGYLNEKYEMDFRCIACSQQVPTHTHVTEHKIRKLNEISASEAENYLGYQTVGTGWLHYTLYHTDSNAWFILFFVIYSSHARNSYSLELIHIKTIVNTVATIAIATIFSLSFSLAPPESRASRYIAHWWMCLAKPVSLISYHSRHGKLLTPHCLCCWTRNRRYGRNVRTVSVQYIYEQWASSSSLKLSNHLPSPPKCVRNLWILSLHIPFYLVKHLPFLPFRWASSSSW